MDYRQAIQAMTPDTYARLQRALEIGKWPDGSALTDSQKTELMQAVIAYGEIHLEPSERSGFIDRGHKAGDSCDDPLEQALNWQQQGAGD
jgi:uncharacterized protein YeaC (DUF1315 family)